MKSTKLYIIEYLTRNAAIFITCFLAMLITLPPVFAQNAKSSVSGGAKKAASGKTNAAAKKKTSSRQRKKRRAEQTGIGEISGPPPTKPDSFDKDLRALPQIGPPASEKNRDNEEFERELPPVKNKIPMPGAIGPPYIRQEQPLFPAMPSPSANFAGLDYNNWGSGNPSDTVGDVGRNHYIQAVNSSFAVYKKNGTRLAAMTFNNFWFLSGAGTPCADSHRGDPTVVFDLRYNGRWIVADFAFNGDGSAPPYYECIAVSKTGDPVSGGWWLYAIRMDDAAHPWFADYPKMGIWRDGLYMTANMFLGNDFKESRIWAFSNTDLVNGLPVRKVVVDLNTATDYLSLLPANFRGQVPNINREEFIVGESRNFYQFDVFKFKPNFAVPGSSTFTFTPAAVIQTMYELPNELNPSLRNSLDTVNGDTLKMQAQYRIVEGKESLWVSHTVKSSPTAPNGIQWAEIDVKYGIINPTPVQQQIYDNLSGDGLYRWMSSLAIDYQGNMLLGYSASSSTSNPSIRYNGRLATDPLNMLPLGEMVMQSGGGSLSGMCRSSSAACTRWGDYSAMTIDPSDHCTFWYTTLYYTANQLAWNTRIGSVKFTGCKLPDDVITDFPGKGGKTGLSVFRPSTGEWWIQTDDNGQVIVKQFGNSTDKITPGDFTGDTLTDVAVFRPSTGEWFVLRSEDDSFYSFPFGASGDIPVQRDYDDDGLADAAVFRPSNATWYISLSNGGTSVQQFGVSGDKPVPADYDGDGVTDIAIFRPSTGTWWINRSSLGVIALQFGNSTDKIVPGDYTGDGKTDAAVWRPSTGEWFVLRSENQSYYSAPFGTNGDMPVLGDYDGDGRFDFAVFRPSSSTWFIQKSGNGVTLIQQFGSAGDVPVPSAFVQ